MDNDQRTSGIAKKCERKLSLLDRLWFAHLITLYCL
jgi:hypothetical protein